ncbi:sugar phosphate isomerase/epimerase [Amaricoccus macauensis]|uniref:Sugar phosphate isomerase/epimerase n=1 Tax=Amaricoccus macauensis TaxID=57001 RepID=A0A840SIM0_9RHOB|nr:sugar phosphate isomerase/epimerase [Amaricoccus macauensis]MBB5220610.1 sugar phosphate isomerase/epimerase [Amaricoccus macauensis]
MTEFSYQLYSSRNFPPLADTLKMLAEVGYRNVEGYGALYADDAKVAELSNHLGDNNLRMPTAHIGLDMLEGEPGKVLAIAKALGIETIYCPYLAPGDRPTDGAGWRAFGERLQLAGMQFREAGLGFGWHNHDFEFQRTADGVLPIMALFEGGPDLEWEADLAWVVRGGADPLEWIRNYGKRITAVHMKDIAPPGEKADEDGWADVGTGTVDWKTIMAALRTTRTRYIIMEHDNPKDDRRFAETSLANAEAL